MTTFQAPVHEAPHRTPQPGAPAPGPRSRWAARLTGLPWRRVTRELFYIAIFALLYEELRLHMVQAGGAAARHALGIVSAEQTLGIFHEHAVQAAFLRWPDLITGFNLYYGGTHFLVPIVLLAWLLLRHPVQYARARTTLAGLTAVAFVVFWLYPVAPPHLLPRRFHIADTLITVGHGGHLETALINTAGDRYASMPSLHVAWAVWCALAAYPMLRHWALRALAVAYPFMTVLVVVVTGNHFFLDAIAGTTLACVSWAVVGWVTAWLAARADPSAQLLTPLPLRLRLRMAAVAQAAQLVRLGRLLGRGIWLGWLGLIGRYPPYWAPVGRDHH